MPKKNLKYLSCEVKPLSFNKTIKVPTSKSYANRYLIMGAISKEEVRIDCLPESTDVLSMIKCLKSIGLDIIQNETYIIIKNSFPECEIPSNEVIKIETGDGGTTTRFLLALLARGSNTYELIPTGHMKNRPMEDLTNSLESLSVTISHGLDYWIRIKGPITTKDKNIEVNGKVSTQFVTAIAMAISDLDIKVLPVNIENSLKYYELTLDILKDFKTKHKFVVPVDYSSVSYPMALGVTLGRISIANATSIDRFQADSIFFSILKEAGADINISENGMICKKSKLRNIDIDCSGFPDLTPTLAYICSTIEGENILRDLEVLRHKESDRVEEIIKVLKAFDVSCEYKNNNLHIIGNKNVSDYVEYHPPSDHRIIMMAYLLMRNNSGGKLHNIKHTDKSYPNFFESMS